MPSYREKSNCNFFLKKKRSKEPVKGPWTKEEDDKLKKWVEKNKACNWTKCSETIPGRSGKQCREHWNNTLNPDLLKGEWTSEEDLLIMIFYKKYDGSWKKIIPIFPKRTENSIKNRFYSQLRKIASKQQQMEKKEYSTKYSLKTLIKYLHIGTKEAKEEYFKQNKDMDEQNFEEYIKNIEQSLKLKKKEQKYINISSINKKINNNKIINLQEENDDLNESTTEKIPNIKTKPKKSKSIKISDNIVGKTDFEDPKNSIIQRQLSKALSRKNSKKIDEANENNIKNQKEINKINEMGEKKEEIGMNYKVTNCNGNAFRRQDTLEELNIVDKRYDFRGLGSKSWKNNIDNNNIFSMPSNVEGYYQTKNSNKLSNKYSKKISKNYNY